MGLAKNKCSFFAACRLVVERIDVQEVGWVPAPPQWVEHPGEHAYVLQPHASC